MEWLFDVLRLKINNYIIIDNFFPDDICTELRGKSLNAKEYDDKYWDYQSLDFDYKYTQNRGSPNSSFQFVPQQYRSGIYHSDYVHHYICIIYLSLGSPVDSGTEVCDFEQKEGRKRDNTIKTRYNKAPFYLIKRYNYDRMRKKINLDYKPIMKIPHKFNRAVIFPAGNWHRAQNFFGTSIENGRLTSVSFLGNID